MRSFPTLAQQAILKALFFFKIAKCCCRHIPNWYDARIDDIFYQQKFTFLANSGICDMTMHLPHGRSQLSAVVAASRDVIRLEDAAKVLGGTRVEASKQLSRWAEQGWLRRVGRGAYVAAPIDSLASDQVLTDPWVLVPALFGPGYIAGRTAAEQWDLTEQISNDIVVFSARPLREKQQVRHGAKFSLKHIRQENIFGLKSVWRGQTKVQISDLDRTVVDMLDDPSIGGGIQHVADCFAAYLARPDRDLDKLIEYGDRLGNGAVFKRMGYLVAERPDCSEVAEACLRRLTKGNAKLDPALPADRLVSKWHLWIPRSWARARDNDR